MKSTELAKFHSTTLDRPIGTVMARIAELQVAGLVAKGSRGRFSGADMTECDVVNLLLALELDTPRGGDVADMVRQTSTLFHDRMPIALPGDFARGLKCFSSVDAGTMMKNIIADLRSGRFEKWAEGEPFKFSATIFQDGTSVSLSLNKVAREPGDIRGAIQIFAKRGFDERKSIVERQTTVTDHWFRRVAELMGPVPI